MYLYELTFGGTQDFRSMNGDRVGESIEAL